MTNPRDLIQRLADAIDSNIPHERLKQSSLMVEVDAYLAQPEPEWPTDEELWYLYDEKGGDPGDCAWVRDYARAVLARYGHHPTSETHFND